MMLVMFGLGASPAAAQTRPEDPTVLHGVGKIVHGIVFEPVMTLLDSTMRHPPVVGTLVGIFAGVLTGLQMSTEGVKELYLAMSPRHRDARRKRDKKLDL